MGEVIDFEEERERILEERRKERIARLLDEMARQVEDDDDE